VTGHNGRRASYQKRSEAKVGMGSSGITPISKTPGKKMKGCAEDEFDVGDDISDYEERGSQEGAWPGTTEGRRGLR